MSEDRIDNRLLRAMAQADYSRLASAGSIVDLLSGTDLALPDEPVTFCWFPTSGLISMIGMDDEGHEAEVGMIGNEGVADGSALLGDAPGTLRMLVQAEGSAFRVDLRVMREAMAESADLLKIILAYFRAFTTQITASAVAYAIYPIPKRLARWLLMAADRLNATRIPFTHEMLSIMLGVRRAGVTAAVRTLVNRGLIEARRGVVDIVDRDGLVTFAGSSYGGPEREYRHLFR